VFRGPGLRDVLGMHDEEAPHGTVTLMAPLMEHGRVLEAAEPPDVARARFEADVAELPDEASRLVDPVAPVPAVSERLRRLDEQVGSARPGS
jgi:nicotinate phosphoribosyltransferase